MCHYSLLICTVKIKLFKNLHGTCVNTVSQAVKTKIEETNCILTTMSKQRKKWEERLEECQSRLDSIPGHAMLCAAGVHYLARVPTGLHKELLTNWLGYCSGSVSLGSILQDTHKLQPAQVPMW